MTWSAGPSLRSEVGHLQPQVQRIKSKVHGPFLHPADVMILQMSCFMLACDPCFEVASDPQRVSKVLVHFPFAVKPECNGVTGGAECDPAYYDPGAEVRRSTWAAMEFALRMGRVRAIGVSNYQVKHLLDT